MASVYKTSPYDVGPDWKWPLGVRGQRPGVSAYPSEFQFDGSYMVQVEVVLEDSDSAAADCVVECNGMMTLFYFTF